MNKIDATTPRPGGRPIADDFRGDNSHLKACIAALIQMNDDGALVPHGIGGHARTLLSTCYHRIPSRDVHELLKVATAALNQAADLAAMTETTDSQHSLASRLLMILESTSSQIRRFLDEPNDQTETQP